MRCERQQKEMERLQWRTRPQNEGGEEGERFGESLKDWRKTSRLGESI